MREPSCPDCEGPGYPVTRRQFVKVVGTTAALAAAAPLASNLRAEASKAAPESLVKTLYDGLQPAQRDEICFDWNHEDDRGLLRTHVSNNWQITDMSKLNVAGDFFTADQKELIRQIFFGMYNPEWHDRIL